MKSVDWEEKKTVSKAQQSALDLQKCFKILKRNMRLLEKQVLLKNYYITRNTFMNVNLPNGHRTLLPKNDSFKPVICLHSLMNGQVDCILSVQQQGITGLSTAGLPETKPQATEGVSRNRLVLLHTGKERKRHKNHSSKTMNLKERISSTLFSPMLQAYTFTRQGQPRSQENTFP